MTTFKALSEQKNGKEVLMKAWFAQDVTGLGAGLGKMDIIVIPQKDGNSLLVKLTTDGRAWVGKQQGHPSAEDPLQKIEIPNKLAEEASFSFDVTNGNFNRHAKNLLFEFAKKVKERS
jgi:hypothetical protein